MNSKKADQGGRGPSRGLVVCRVCLNGRSFNSGNPGEPTGELMLSLFISFGVDVF